MFNDPQSITITGLNGGVAISLPRVLMEGQSATYQSADGTIVLTISHQLTKDRKRYRTSVRLEQKTISADPLVSPDDWDSVVETRIIDRPVVGFTSQQVERLDAGFSTWMSAATVAKLYAREP